MNSINVLPVQSLQKVGKDTESPKGENMDAWGLLDFAGLLSGMQIGNTMEGQVSEKEIVKLPEEMSDSNENENTLQALQAMFLQNFFPAGKDANSGENVSQGESEIKEVSADLTKSGSAQKMFLDLVESDMAHKGDHEQTRMEFMVSEGNLLEKIELQKTELDKNIQAIDESQTELIGGNDSDTFQQEDNVLAQNDRMISSSTNQAAHGAHGMEVANGIIGKNTYSINDYLMQGNNESEDAKILDPEVKVPNRVEQVPKLGDYQKVINNLLTELSGEVDIKPKEQNLKPVELEQFTSKGVNAQGTNELDIPVASENLTANDNNSWNHNHESKSEYTNLGIKANDDGNVLQELNTEAKNILSTDNGEPSIDIVSNEDVDILLVNKLAESEADTAEVKGNVEMNILEFQQQVVLQTSNASKERNTPKAIVQQIVDDVQQYLQSDSSAEISKLEIDLHPAELGKIRLSLHLEGETVHIQVMASEASTGKILNNNMNELRQSLNDIGVSCGNLEMNYNGSQQGFSSEHRRNQYDYELLENQLEEDVKLLDNYSNNSLSESNRLNVTV